MALNYKVLRTESEIPVAWLLHRSLKSYHPCFQVAVKLQFFF